MYIFDLHCDLLNNFYKNPNYDFLLNNGHISEIGLNLGGYLAQCFAIFLPPEVPANNNYFFFKTQYNLFCKVIKKSRTLRQAKTKRDILKNAESGKISAILTVENADFLGGDIKKLKIAENLGVKILGLVWNNENCLGYPNSAAKNINNLPLKNFGCAVIDYLNYSPIIPDVSHLNYGGFNSVANIFKKPFIASHSACSEIYPHPRNLTDEQIKKIANSGGVVGINFYSKFLNGTNTTTIADIILHLKHLIKIGGQDIAALGSDFDGIDCNLFLKNCSQMPILADALIKNFGTLLAEKICFKNALRVL